MCRDLSSRQRCSSVMLCSHLTFAFASTSTSLSYLNIASVVTQTRTQRMDLDPFCWGMTIPNSLICMSSHKTSVARWLLSHQATSGQPAIYTLPQSPLRRLVLSMLFTIVTTSYQTTCTSLQGLLL